MSHIILRRRQQINWKLLHEGHQEDLEKPSKERAVLPGAFEVERLIWRRESKHEEYLVKWRNYPIRECRWEPANHLPDNLIRSYLTPELSGDRLYSAAAVLQSAIQSRLRK